MSYVSGLRRKKQVEYLVRDGVVLLVFESVGG